MNIYAASVALLWTTAMHPSGASRARAHGDEPLRSAGCDAPPRPQPQGWRLWRGVRR